MKLKRIALMIAAVYLAAGVSVSFAGVDMQKWESFVRSELESVAQQVDKSGKAPVGRPLVADYDTNKDNFIDAKEVKAIRAYLGNKPQVSVPAVRKPEMPAAVKPMPAPKKQADSYAETAPKKAKKKEWWKY